MKSLLNCLGSLLVLMTLSTSLWAHSPTQSHATLEVEEDQGVLLEDGIQVNYITDAGQPSFTIGDPVVAQASFPLLRLLFLIGPAFVILGMAYRIDKFAGVEV